MAIGEKQALFSQLPPVLLLNCGDKTRLSIADAEIGHKKGESQGDWGEKVAKKDAKVAGPVYPQGAIQIVHQLRILFL